MEDRHSIMGVQAMGQATTACNPHRSARHPSFESAALQVRWSQKKLAELNVDALQVRWSQQKLAELKVDAL
jgi:hypothetical protein